MYHENFPAHPVQQRAPRPLQEAYKSGGTFDGTTTSGSTYTAHPIPPRAVHPAAIFCDSHSLFCNEWALDDWKALAAFL